MKKNIHKIPISSKWIEFAEEDFKTALFLWESGSELYRSICYHSQQFVEKVLKGLLEAADENPPRIHDITALLNMCKKAGIKIPLSEDYAHFLSSVYIDARYPPDIGLLPEGEPGEEEGNLCIKILNELNDWLKSSTEIIRKT